MPKSVRLITTVDENKCAGCGKCAKACPYIFNLRSGIKEAANIYA